MNKSKQKWWVRWYVPGEDPAPVTQTRIEWWGGVFSGSHTLISAIVYADDEDEVLEVLRANGWPECTPEDISSCEPMAADWRPWERGAKND